MGTFGRTTSIESFNEISSYDFTNQLAKEIKNEIEGRGKAYILGVEEDDYKKYLIQKYTLDPLKIDYDSESIEEPTVSKEWIEDRMWGEKHQTDVYTFTAKYSFVGSAILFKVQPSTRKMTSTKIYVNENSGSISFSFKVSHKDPKEFDRIKSNYQRKAFSNLENANKDAIIWNEALSGLTNRLFHKQKDEFLKENSFFAAINVKVNQDTSSVFSTPTIKKKVVPQPTLSTKAEFSSEPMMANEMYTDILKVIYDFGKSMEKKPSIYQGRDEESIRDQFLLILETRYDATTATGETFNRGGKTDIILKYANDGTNLFVAECKLWHGAAEFHKGISQLFDRYLTWRDSKVALLLFVRNKDFTNIVNIIKEEALKHPYFLSVAGQRGETSFSYQFHLPADKEKKVHFEIIAFHFDKLRN